MMLPSQGRGGGRTALRSLPTAEEKQDEPGSRFRVAGVRAAVNHEISQQKPLDSGSRKARGKRKKPCRSGFPKERKSCGGCEAARKRRIDEARMADFAEMHHRDEHYLLRALEDVATSKDAQFVKMTAEGIVAYALQYPGEFLDRMQNGTEADGAAGRMVGKFMDMEDAPVVTVYGKKYTASYDGLLNAAQRAAEHKG